MQRLDEVIELMLIAYNEGNIKWHAFETMRWLCLQLVGPGFNFLGLKFFFIGLFTDSNNKMFPFFDGEFNG